MRNEIATRQDGFQAYQIAYESGKTVLDALEYNTLT